MMNEFSGSPIFREQPETLDGLDFAIFHQRILAKFEKINKKPIK